MDAVGRTLLQRVSELLDARPDLKRTEFGRRIGRGHSWISEFFSEARTTDDLRLVVKMARVFGVNVGYLLGETERPLDAGAATLLATWQALAPADRELLLSVAASFRQRFAPTEAADGSRADDAPESFGHRRPARDEPPRRKR